MAELPDGTEELVARALAEDLGSGDVTSEATVPGDAAAVARIALKEPGIVYGLEVAGEVFRQAGATGFESLATNKLGDESFASPAICGGRIYLRTARDAGGTRQELLYCIGLPSPPPR